MKVELTLCLLERSLMLAQTLCGRHALAKRPFYDLSLSVSKSYMFMSFQYTLLRRIHSWLIIGLLSGSRLFWVLADWVKDNSETCDCDNGCEDRSA